MNEEETILFDSKDNLVCVTYEGGAYYFTVAKSDVRGPYFEEAEAYQEALRELASCLAFTMDLLRVVEKKATLIAELARGEDYIYE